MNGIAFLTPGVGGVDDAVAINAALLDPDTAVVMLAAGNFGTDTTIIVPAGKHLAGAGTGATRIVRRNATVTETGFDPALVRTVDGATGVRISDLSLEAPKSGVKVMGVWLRKAVGAAVERVECFNMGYAFWAQEYASRCVFRDVASWNANVHFEATQAYDILFENMVSGDGDGDNPLGCEAVWHCLLASRNITFRNGRHSGRGQPFLVVANDINEDPQGGLVDNILYENCRSVQTDDKIALFVTRINGQVGRVYLNDCDNVGRTGGGGLPARIEAGAVRMRGGDWRSEDRIGFDVLPNASLEWSDPHLSLVNIPATTNGVFFGASGSVRIDGGILSTNTPRIDLGGPQLTLTPATRIVRPGNDRIYAPVIGAPARYVYTADFARTGDGMIGNDSLYATTGLPALGFVPVAGAQYRLRVRGKIRKPDATQYLRVYIDNAASIDWSKAYGFTRLQKADGSWETNSPGYGARGAQVADATNGAVRDFEMDITFFGVNTMQVMSGADANVVLKGAEVVVERLA